MDFYRFLVVGLFNLFVVIVQTPPNVGRETENNNKIEEKGRINYFFLRFVIIIATCSFLSMRHLYSYAESPLTYLEIFVVLITIAGFILRIWCYWILGEMFTSVVTLKQNHKLITTGPFKYLVHPSYLGQMVTLNGVLLFYNEYALIAVALLGLYNFKTVPERMAIEENFLKENFGQEYEEYIKKRWRLIPFYL